MSRRRAQIEGYNLPTAGQLKRSPSVFKQASDEDSSGQLLRCVARVQIDLFELPPPRVCVSWLVLELLIHSDLD